jgi:hypothetical protein
MTSLWKYPAPILGHGLYVTSGILTALANPAFADVSAAELKAHYKNSTMFITVFYTDSKNQMGHKTGSGFLVSSSGYVITSHHLIQEELPDKSYRRFPVYKLAGRVGASFDPGFPVGDGIYEMDMIEALDDQDAMLLKVRRGTVFEPLQICKEPIVPDGDPLIYLGFPREQELSARTATLDHKDGLYGMWQLEAAINPGNSGGPVFNNEGSLVGLVYGDVSNANDISYMVPLNHFNALLDAAQVPMLDCEVGESQLRKHECEVRTVDYSVNWIQEDHSGLKSTQRSFGQTFEAQPDYAIVDYDVRVDSVNNSAGHEVRIAEDKQSLSFSTNLTSGPLYDQWRGWLNATVITKQAPLECLK